MNISANMVSKACFNNCASFFNDINISKIPYAVIKGEALSIQAYGHEGKRATNDIDILISIKDAKAIESILKVRGFDTVNVTRSDRILFISLSHQFPVYQKTAGSLPIKVDLNHDIFWGEYEGNRIDINDFLSDSIITEVYGIRVSVLPKIKALIQLILHHYKDMNSIYLLATRNNTFHDMFKDVYYLLKNNLNEISMEKLHKTSGKFGVIPYVYYILYHTGLVFEDNVLKKFIEAFKTSEGVSLLNCYGLNANERREWKYDFKTRLKTNNLYELIKSDLTPKDAEKIKINRRVFLGE